MGRSLDPIVGAFHVFLILVAAHAIPTAVITAAIAVVIRLNSCSHPEGPPHDIGLTN